MFTWRLASAEFPALDGAGSRLRGGRWNSPGIAVVYTAGSLSLAIIEMLVHTEPDLVPDDLVAHKIEIPESEKPESLESLPKDWDSINVPTECQRVGDAWVKSARSLLLTVPSVIVPEETNYLLNPAHPAMSLVRIAGTRSFSFGPRLLKVDPGSQSRSSQGASKRK